ncbi:ABC transporter permease [Gilvimarinus xylanilyticus]|uniref:ABC transporter permease n=1 Tax=Gilvimarinus xylanilyticus TaxID=2944139 RepID=A0A9X2KTN8_9GAMM|nr:ABC transporter permease [Gilvimarinus xylanilyticus]MCP8899489.1 ABC transporter permease [Gilvimarinus xylanilyticus]
MMFRLAWKSLLSRRFSAAVCIAMVALSTLVLLSVDTVYRGAQSAFSRSVQGIDLIVGAPTGEVNLLLFSAFHVGAPSRELSWQTFQQWEKSPGVARAVPLMLGDSHQGFRVIGTNQAMFDHLAATHDTAVFTQGKAFAHVFEVTLGHEVARTLGYPLGKELILSHGLGNHSFQQHEARTFTVTGILAPTGTPIDKTLQVSTEAIEAIHWPPARLATLPSQPTLGETAALQPDRVSAFYLTLANKVRTFQIQRAINQSDTEPTQAILPGVAITRLWGVMDWVQMALMGLGLLAALMAAIGVASSLLSHLDRRVAEFQLLQLLGARRRFIYTLLGLESGALIAIGIIAGTALTVLLERGFSVIAQSHWGLYWPLQINGFALGTAMLAAPLLGGLLITLAGAWRLAKLP